MPLIFAVKLVDNFKSKHLATQKTIDRIVHNATPRYLDISMQQMRHVRGATTGPRAKRLYDVQRQPQRTVPELLSQGFEYVSCSGKPIILLDQHYRLFGCFTGCPGDPSYVNAADRAFQLIMQLSSQASQVPSSGVHKRGDFSAVNFGIHYGIGLKAPCRLELSTKAAGVVERLVGDPDIQRIAHFDSAAGGFATSPPLAVG